MNNAKDQFIKAIKACGIIPPETIEADGKLHRFASNGKRGDDSGWYVLHDGEHPAGAFGCWRLDITETWKADIGREYTPEEKAVFKKRAEESRAQAEAERKAEQERAREQVHTIWQLAKEANAEHPYLTAKDVLPYGIRQNGENLIIPMRDGKALHSLQTIYPDGNKRFHKGGKVEGCYLAIDGDNEAPFCIAEGYATGASIHQATGYPVCVAFNAGNLLPIALKMRKRFPDRKIIIAADDDYRTADKDGNLFNTGITKAAEAAKAINGYLAIPDFGENRPEGATDFNDLQKAKGMEMVRDCLNAAKYACAREEEGQDYGKIEETDKGEKGEVRNLESQDNPKKETLEAAVKRLAGLSNVQYAQERKSAAKRHDIGPALLDKLVREEQKEQTEEDSLFPEVEPWEDAVNGIELLTEISDTLKRFIVCKPETAHAAALWIVMTWLMDAVKVAPLAVITAPEKRCGKTQLLEMIGKMSSKPMFASNITAAALFRSIEMWSPTLLIDEADAFLKDNEDMRGLLNAGHTRTTAYTVRTVGDDHTPKRFNLWGAKAVSGIGKLADTIMDRAIVLELRRKLDCEMVDRIRHAETGLFETIQRKLCRFAEDHEEDIRKAKPSLPEELNDRAQDNWEPLLAIADTAGGVWPELARKAALTISGDKKTSQSLGVELLDDIKEVFDEKKLERVFTYQLVDYLCEDSEKSWATYNRGKPITPKQLSIKLSGYGIRSKDVRIGYDKKKGFETSQFDDAFARYLNISSITPLSSETSRQTSIHAGLAVSFRKETKLPETQIETLKPSTGAGCRDVSVKIGGYDKKIENEGKIEVTI